MASPPSEYKLTWVNFGNINVDATIYILDVSGVLEAPLQFVFVTSLSNKRYSYHLCLLFITKSINKKEK